jgi:hypothetical protein
VARPFTAWERALLIEQAVDYFVTCELIMDKKERGQLLRLIRKLKAQDRAAGGSAADKFPHHDY